MRASVTRMYIPEKDATEALQVGADPPLSGSSETRSLSMDPADLTWGPGPPKRGGDHSVRDPRKEGVAQIQSSRQKSPDLEGAGGKYYAH